MTIHDDTDRRIAAWFGDEHARAPERTIEAALAHARSHPRRRDPFAALRRDPMSGGARRGGLFAPIPLLVAIGLVVVAVLGAAVAGGFLDRPAPVVPVPSVGIPSAEMTPVPTPVVFHVDLVEVVGDDASIDITDASGSDRLGRIGPAPRRRFGPGRGRCRRGSGGSGGRCADVDGNPVRHDPHAGDRGGRPHDDARTSELPGSAIARDLQVRPTYREPIDVGTISASLVTGQG